VKKWGQGMENNIFFYFMSCHGIACIITQLRNITIRSVDSARNTALSRRFLIVLTHNGQLGGNSGKDVLHKSVFFYF